MHPTRHSQATSVTGATHTVYHSSFQSLPAPRPPPNNGRACLDSRHGRIRRSVAWRDFCLPARCEARCVRAWPPCATSVAATLHHPCERDSEENTTAAFSTTTCTTVAYYRGTALMHPPVLLTVGSQSCPPWSRPPCHPGLSKLPCRPPRLARARPPPAPPRAPPRARSSCGTRERIAALR